MMELFFCCIVIINLVMSVYCFSFFLFVFLKTDFRMKTMIEINMFEYSNELICIPIPITWDMSSGVGFARDGSHS